MPIFCDARFFSIFGVSLNFTFLVLSCSKKSVRCWDRVLLASLSLEVLLSLDASFNSCAVAAYSDFSKSFLCRFSFEYICSNMPSLLLSFDKSLLPLVAKSICGVFTAMSFNVIISSCVFRNSLEAPFMWSCMDSATIFLSLPFDFYFSGWLIGRSTNWCDPIRSGCVDSLTCELGPDCIASELPGDIRTAKLL